MLLVRQRILLASFLICCNCKGHRNNDDPVEWGYIADTLWPLYPAHSQMDLPCISLAVIHKILHVITPTDVFPWTLPLFHGENFSFLRM